MKRQRHQRTIAGPVTVDALRARCPVSTTLTARAMLGFVIQQARARAVPYAAYVAAHGIMQGLTSGRCSAPVRAWVGDMTAEQILTLVCEVTGACTTIAEVPQYLNARVWPQMDTCA
jgi:hypothetical protein